MEKELLSIFDENNYTSIKERSKAIELGIDVKFLYDENDDDNYPKELLDIYISENRNELFIILNCANLQADADISEVCNAWDQKLLLLSNFGMTDLYKLKYNMVQILICTDDNIDRIVEGSVNISRKIILKCDEGDDGNFYINEVEAVEIPFYMPKFGEISNDNDRIMELKSIIPNEYDKINSSFFKTYQKNNRPNNNRAYYLPEEVQKRFESWLEQV